MVQEPHGPSTFVFLPLWQAYSFSVCMYCLVFFFFLIFGGFEPPILGYPHDSCGFFVFTQVSRMAPSTSSPPASIGLWARRKGRAPTSSSAPQMSLGPGRNPTSSRGPQADRTGQDLDELGVGVRQCYICKT